MDQENRNEQVETEATESAEQVEGAEATDAGEAGADTRSREELIAELEDYKSRYFRAQADFDNFRRRSRQEKEEFAAYANNKILEELLTVLDTFEMALKTPETADTKTLLVGVDMVHRQLLTVLNNHGLTPIEAVGQAFDPNFHEGIMTVASSDHPANTVIEELRKGYKVKEKVLRPAMVKISE
ncbi:MAG: nucleotide exchange factor GrpE [Tumebacillaceae bacterium]